MPFKLPRFDKTTCVNMTLCGKLKPKGEKTSLKRIPTMVCVGRSGSGTVYLRALHHRKNSECLHIDCASERFFLAENKPEPTTVIKSFFSKLNKLIGSKIDVYIEGTFYLPFDFIQEGHFLQFLLPQKKPRDFNIEISSAQFNITGLPISSAEWIVLKEHNIICIKLEAQRNMEITENYFQDALNWIDIVFYTFYFGARNV